MTMSRIERFFTRTGTAGAVALPGAVNTPLTPEQSRDRVNTGLKWALGLGVAVLAAPVIYLAIKGAVGLMVAGALGMLGVHGTPVLSLKLANWRLRSMRNEVRAHPLDTLEQLLLDKQRTLKLARGQLTEALGGIASFVESTQDFARDYPDDAKRWLNRAAQAERLAQHKREAFKTAQAAVQAFAQEVRRARAEHRLVEAHRAFDQACTDVLDDPQAQWLEHTALDSLRTDMNRAFASLDTALAVAVPGVGLSAIPTRQ